MKEKYMGWEAIMRDRASKKRMKIKQRVHTEKTKVDAAFLDYS